MYKKEDTQKEQISVLGKTFSNEDERRKYFREELRKKLPDLKKMEGFPIGEDEDILNLSDPPFFTACPNPWLDDSVEQWEEEKKEMEKQGKRYPNFEVDEPYAADVSEGKNNPVYKAHSYVTKVPHPAIMRFILHYTQPGDIVFDGFSGTGMTGVASLLAENPPKTMRHKLEKEGSNKIIWGERKYVGSDLSVLASFIAKHLNHPTFEVDKFEMEISKIKEALQQEHGWMYKTLHSDNKTSCNVDYFIWSDKFVCNDCSNEFVFWDEAVDIKKSKVLEEFPCPSCHSLQKKRKLKTSFKTVYENNTSKRVSDKQVVLIKYSFQGKSYLKKPDESDVSKLEKIDSTQILNDYPTSRLPDGGETRRNDRFGLTHTNDFFTKRNLIVLSALKSKLKVEYQIIFTALLNRATKLNSTVMSNFFKQMNGKTVGGWAGKPREGTLYLPSISTEVNVLKTIDSRLASLKRLKLYIKDFKENSSIISTSSSTQLPLKDKSIDYIFIDPPFGANRAYSELNFLTEDWLQVKTNSTMEAIENKSVNKSLPEYFGLMQKCFSEFYRILKPGKWMTVEFSNTNASVWNGIQTSIQKAGFVIANVTGLDKKQGSIQALTTVTAVKQDLVISCYKPSSKFDKNFETHRYEPLAIWHFIEEHLNHLPIHLVKENATTAIVERSPKILFDRLIAYYVQKNLSVPIDAVKFQQGLRERFAERDGMFFNQERVQEYDKKRAEVPDFIQLSILVSSEQDGVLWLKSQLQEKRQTYQDIHPQWMQALAGVRKGDIIPELDDVLEENFLKDKDGKWYVPDPEKEADLEKMRNKRLLRQFEEYKKEAIKPKGKIKEARVEALRVGFKQSYQDKDFKTIVQVGDRIPNLLLMEDEVLLQFYDIASSRV